MKTESNAMKTATVLTLSYNSPDLLCAIDSVLAQSYGNIQHIIVDDGSEEFNREAVLDYIAKNNRGNVTAEIIVNEENQGIIKSSNIGLSCAKGDYIINLAGDDCFYDERVVEDVVAEFERTGALVLTGYRSVCDSEMRELGVYHPTAKQRTLIKNSTPQQLFEEMAGFNLIFGCCTSYAKQCFEQYGYYDETYRNLDDYTLNMRLLRNGIRITFYERLFVKYRSNGTSAVANVKDAYLEESDKVFEQEILPYSLCPQKAQKKYAAWKRRLETDKQYAQKVEQCGENKKKRLVLKCGYYLVHPHRLISVLLEKTIYR